MRKGGKAGKTEPKVETTGAMNEPKKIREGMYKFPKCPECHRQVHADRCPNYPFRINRWMCIYCGWHGPFDVNEDELEVE